nr:GDSL-type esterase/lipase family protein [Neptunicella marina]
MIEGLSVSAVVNNSVNFGIGLDTLSGLIRRIPTYSNLDKADTIVIHIGLNDLPLQTDISMLNGYTQLVSVLPSHVPVVITSILMPHKVSDKKAYQSRIEHINQELSSLCNIYQNVYFFDLNKALENNADKINDLYLPDGTHLNQAGNQIWISTLQQQISDINNGR